MGREDLNKARKKRLVDNAVDFQNKVIPSELLPHLTCLTDGTKVISIKRSLIVEKKVNFCAMFLARDTLNFDPLHAHPTRRLCHHFGGQ